MVDKYLYPVGGAEIYMFSVGAKLVEEGHEVQYFGLKDKRNTAGNSWNILVKGYKDKKIFNPFSLIYSKSAKRKMRKLLKLYQPDLVHMNNITYDLTSSIVDACKEKNIPVIMTVHDPQLLCGNHMFYRLFEGKKCTECLDGNFKHCLHHKCLKNSKLKSYLAYKESVRTHRTRVYDYISYFISPSDFLRQKFIEGGYAKEKCLHICNPLGKAFECKTITPKKDYILYHGRISKEKGLDVLIQALPEDIHLIIAGTGPLVDELPTKSNITYVGFQSGEALIQLIQEARFTVYPSVWYENCPISILESISLGTPVIGSTMGGIPELIDDGKTGLLFESENVEDLKNKIIELYHSSTYEEMLQNCLNKTFIRMEDYYTQLLELYTQAIESHQK